MTEAELLRKARDIVGRHSLPDFVTGFDVRLAEFDGDEALYVYYDTIALPRFDTQSAERRVPEIIALQNRVMTDLLAEIDDYFPYFRFRPAEAKPSST